MILMQGRLSQDDSVVFGYLCLGSAVRFKERGDRM